MIFAFLFGPALGSDIHLTTDDRIQAMTFGPNIKLHRPEQVAVIGHGNGGHFVFHRTLENGVVPQGGIEQTVRSV